jgi:hypothetical protein
VYVVKLSSDPKIPPQQAVLNSLNGQRQIFQFYPIEDVELDLDKFLGFTDNYLFVANDCTIKYCKVPVDAFVDYTGVRDGRI